FGIAGGLLALAMVVGLVVLNRTQGGRSVGSPKLAEGTLAPCPESPNCISTRAPAEDTRHFVDPIPVAGEPDKVIAALAAIMEEQPRMRVIERGDRYVRATATSTLFRFVDDVDFLVDSEAGLLHMRSASRVGQGDIGVNRKPYEFFRDALSRR
ncbi:MAG: DUF1499 domain-containing protein, partial [Alkalispirochaeta sp.]